MSDAKSAAEIEDILSSIRRLVTEERKPPASRPQILSRLVVEDRLVLTPAQRVKPALVASAEAPDPLRKITLLRRSDTRAEPVPEAPMILDAPVLPPSRPEPAPRLHLAAEAQPTDPLAWEAELGDPAPEVSSLDWSSFTFARRPMAETYAARVQAAERLTRPAPEPEVVQPKPAVAKAEVVAEEVTAEAMPPKDLTAAQVEDNIFSEEVLRELVRDLIREQLQGDLGERITRNIRKLVKAEIARCLTLRAAE